MAHRHVLPHPQPGGSPANVAIGLHRLERPVTLMSCWGDDPPGALIDSYLTATGIRIHRLPSASRRSTIVLAYVNASTGSATYDFVTAWDPVEITVPTDTTLLHTGSLAAVIEPGATPIVKTCRSLRTHPGRAVSIDLNIRPAALPDRDTYRAQAERIVREADIVKASDEDLLWLYPGRSAEESAHLLHAMGPRLVVVTQGSRGAFAVTADQQAAVPAPSVEVIDTIGAGTPFKPPCSTPSCSQTAQSRSRRPITNSRRSFCAAP
jgi:fructokinase